jgi:hypothetical protein
MDRKILTYQVSVLTGLAGWLRAEIMATGAHARINVLLHKCFHARALT